MNLNLTKRFLLATFFLTFLISGCSSLKVVDLNPQPLVSNNVQHDTDIIVSIDPIEIVAGGYKDAEKWQQGLGDVLRNERIFHIISPSIKDKYTDLLIRGKVSGIFRHNGTKNFFTWWPGPLIFAQGWRGTRYIYDAISDIEIVDAKSDKVLGSYHAESTYELIHKSYNPWHFFGTLFIIPGTIKAAVSTTPRVLYRQKIYEAVYPALWKKMALLINEGQSKIFSERIATQKDKCGVKFNEDIKVGMIWTEFASCQTSNFDFLGQQTMESGVVSIYVKKDKSLRVHVGSDGRIIRWYIAKHPEDKGLQAT